MDYEKDIRIDETALDVEWLTHSELALRYVKHAMYMRRIERKKHEVVKTLRADLINKVNEDPKRTTNKDKPNAADIEAYYRRDKKYKLAKEEWINAQYEADYAELVQKEISYGRKAALENLVTLHGQQYFAGPRVPRRLSEEREKHQREVDAKINKAMKRK